ncbi:hypothetical protein BDR26DRAFT_902587 [Obelidium mucronatum]|nr:hypothetical protein BDR26DRAFT_902587 [Obelidium mucronatum]
MTIALVEGGGQYEVNTVAVPMAIANDQLALAHMQMEVTLAQPADTVSFYTHLENKLGETIPLDSQEEPLEMPSLDVQLEEEEEDIDFIPLVFTADELDLIVPPTAAPPRVREIYNLRELVPNIPRKVLRSRKRIRKFVSNLGEFPMAERNVIMNSIPMDDTSKED